MATRKKPSPINRIRKVVPDSIDLRDRVYLPSLTKVPAEMLTPDVDIPVLNQKDTSACTGFALAAVIYHLQLKAKRGHTDYAVSPFMLYSMARRYDEFPGSPDKDTGSSLRGAMKGWYKHGVCSHKLWPEEKMPTAAPSAAEDWWLDAARRPLGAYYRVDSRSVTDMQVALNEIGVLYASAACHKGWDEGSGAKTEHGYWAIPAQKAASADGAHAFAIVGYTRAGFIIQNSWDTDWGTKGRAVLTYQDWLENAMDCWAAQLGVVTDLHLEIAVSTTLRSSRGKVQLASESVLRNRELSPFIIDMENNGLLSNTGEFRTQPSDLTALVNQHLGDARERWGLGAKDPVDIAIYAHGGLTSEAAAAETAAKWIPALYDKKIFPIFLMWETDLWSTLKGRVADLLAKQPRTTGGALDRVHTWWNARLEKLLAVPGTAVWAEMKQNADAVSKAPGSGGIQLYNACMKSPWFADMSRVRLHLVGHSAGAILHSHVIDRLSSRGWNFETVNFLAPAVRVDDFVVQALPAIRKKQVKHFNQFHLSDDVEQADPTCGPILGYNRSLLYLVSQSFEKGRITPILGMEKYFKEAIGSLGLPNVNVVASPGRASKCATHGGFDDDAATRDAVISLILAR